MTKWWEEPSKPFNMRVEYEAIPVRHCAVQCPACEKWFKAYDVLEDGDLTYNHELPYAAFRCPLCNTEFGYGTRFDKEQITEVDYSEIYNDCFEKKVSWEK